MGVINLTKKQAVEVGKLLATCGDSFQVWIHGELESVLVEIEDENYRTVSQFRVWDSGKIEPVPWE